MPVQDWADVHRNPAVTASKITNPAIREKPKQLGSCDVFTMIELNDGGLSFSEIAVVINDCL